MCIVCQTVFVGSAALTGILPVAVPERGAPQPIPATVSPGAAQAASIGETTCKRLGQIRKTSAGSFRCTADGKRRLWKLVGTTSTTTSTKTTVPPTTTTTIEPYRPPSAVGSAADLCRLRDQSMQRRVHGSLLAGFPLIEKNFESQGTFIFALIPIDFSDLRGDANLNTRVSDQMRLVTDWYDMVSEGRVKIEWRVHNEWVRVPGDSSGYALNRSRSDDNRLANAAFAAADPAVDFSGVRAVAFVLPAGQTFMTEGVQGFKHSQFGAAGGYLTAEGRIYNYMLAGAYFDRQYKNYWSYWAHETGHMFPLPDLYDQNTQWWIGKQTPIPGGPFSGFDMMASQDGPSRTLSTWLRFVMGWLDESQVFCKPVDSLAETQITLVPIDERKTGVKSILIPVSDSKLIVVESRRANSKFDCEGTGTTSSSWRARNGVIVYTADLTLGHGEGFQALVAPSGRGLQTLGTCSSPAQYDAILNVGDSVSTNGVTIRLLSSGAYDTVVVTK